MQSFSSSCRLVQGSGGGQVVSMPWVPAFSPLPVPARGRVSSVPPFPTSRARCCPPRVTSINHQCFSLKQQCVSKADRKEASEQELRNEVSGQDARDWPVPWLCLAWKGAPCTSAKPWHLLPTSLVWITAFSWVRIEVQGIPLEVSLLFLKCLSLLHGRIDHQALSEAYTP